MSKRFHLALAASDYARTLDEYTERLGVEPYCTVEGTYILWKTDELNLSVTIKPVDSATLRHVGFEDADANAMTEHRDSDGLLWERFTEAQQRAEILRYWPLAKFRDQGGPG